MQEISDIIARADAKGKILDFRNSLVPANLSDYAMMHGTGGKKHAPASRIRLTLCDYGDKSGGKSTTVAANLAPEYIPILLAVCEKNLGTLNISVKEQVYKDILSWAGKLTNGVRGFYLLIARLMNVCVRATKDRYTTQEMLHDLAAAFKEVKTQLATENQQRREAVLSLPTSTDYSLRQERVNIYKAGPDGYVPVSVLSISRSGYTKDGSVYNAAWNVLIQNFQAQPLAQQNGTTAYIKNTAKDMKQAYIRISNEDMFRCLYRVNRFIEAWEMTVSLPVIREGLAVKERNRQESANNGYVQNY